MQEARETIGVSLLRWGVIGTMLVIGGMVAVGTGPCIWTRKSLL
jgi:hypothetical protein